MQTPYDRTEGLLLVKKKRKIDNEKAMNVVIHIYTSFKSPISRKGSR